MKNFQFSILNFQIIFLLLLLPSLALAETFAVEVDTGRETINALEGTLMLPPGAEIGPIYTGNSVILIWIAPPKIEGNIIRFAGITPGGFRGRYPIFSFDGSSNAGNYSFKSVNAIRSDGSGESVPVKLSVFLAEIKEDNAPPEPFTPIISSSPDLFEGKYFISFMAQDKGTGVSYYEYAPTWLFGPKDSQWVKIESPQLLSFSEMFKRIYIRAVDYEGNSRTVSTAAPYHYYLPIFGVIILLCVLLFLRRSFQLRS